MRVLIWATLAVFSLNAGAATFNVSTTAELRTAFDAAATNGEDDTIVIAGGTYKTTDDSGGRFLYFSNEPNDLSLIGSDNETVFDGDNNDAIFEHLASGDAHTTFKKIIFKNSKGVAIKTDFTVDVIQSTFINNQGSAIQSESNIKIDNSYFLSNSTEENLIYNRTGISNTVKSTFESNSSHTIFYCGNSKSYSCDITISATKFENNDTTEIIKNGGYGNYIEVFDSHFQSQPQTGSRAINLSGGCSAHFKGANNVFDNSEFYIQKNPACSNYSSDQIYVINSLFINSSTYISAENSQLINNIYIGDNYEISGSENSIVETSNNYIDPNKLTVRGFHANNIFSDVSTGFVDAAANDYHLTPSSGLVDAGASNINGISVPATDIDGNPRISGGEIDIGPYEFSDSRPTILSFAVSEELRIGSVIKFAFEIDAADVEAGVATYYDFGDGEEQIAEGGEYVFDVPGSYTVRLIVVNEEGARSSRTLSFDIRDLTLEEKLVAAEQVGKDSVINNPALYGLLTSTDLEAQLGELKGTLTAELESAVQAAYEAVKNDPTAFGVDIGFDIDGDGESKALTDGLLLIRYLFGFTGDSLVSGAISEGAERETAEEVEAYIRERVPAL